MKRKQERLLLFLVFILCTNSFGFSQPSNINALPDAKRTQSPKELVKEVEDLYNQAVIAYEEGNVSHAETLYYSALKKLAKVNLDASLIYQLKEEFDNLFAKLDILLEEIENPAPSIFDASKKELEEVTDLEGRKVGNGYTIPIYPDDELVKKYIRLYTEGERREAIAQALERSGRYRDMIMKALQEYGLPRELIYLPVIESLYKVNAYSRARAVGLWQLMEGTARKLGLVINYWIDERRDPEKSTYAALKFLKDLYAWFNDWHLALAAYNRGEVGIGNDLAFSKATDFTQLVDRKALPKETENFVPQFMACVIIGDNYRDFGFSLNFEEPMVYDEVVLDKVIDLEVIAQCVGTTETVIRELNPALRAWCTPKNYPDFRLRLPYGTKEMFLANIAQVKDLTPGRGFVRHRVKKGETLGKIARQYDTTVYAIKRDNNISNINRIRVGQVLIIKPGRAYFVNKGS